MKKSTEASRRALLRRHATKLYKDHKVLIRIDGTNHIIFIEDVCVISLAIKTKNILLALNTVKNLVQKHNYVIQKIIPS